MGLTGCASQGFYGSPRTLSPGRVQHTLTGDLIGLAQGTGASRTGGILPLPLTGYMVRVGLVDRLEGGARVNWTGSLGADVKLQLVRSRALDLAIDPLMSLSWSTMGLSVPVVVGFNVSPRFQVLLGGRYGYVADRSRNTSVCADGITALPGASNPSGSTPLVASAEVCGSTVGGMAGLRGVVALGRSRIAIQPEYNLVAATGSRAGVFVHVFSLSLAFGGQPAFTPEEEDPDGTDAPPMGPVQAPSQAVPVGMPPPLAPWQ